MVRLNAYRCHNCSLICEHADGFSVGICTECGKLTCGPCRTLFDREKEEAAKCPVTQKNCGYVSLYTGFLNFLHEFPPDDELKVLNYGKWCPVWCPKLCSSSFAIERIGCVNPTTFRCRSCRPADTVAKYPPINTYMKVIDELREYFSVEEYVVPGERGVQLESFHCEKCRGRLHHPLCLSETGDLLCKNCKDTLTAHHCVYSGNLYFLGLLIIYIPCKDDLRLLTYSKWTPLRCELCSTLFSTNFLRTPMFHPGCSKLICNQCAWKHTCFEPNSTSLQLKWVLDVDKEFRSLFKNGGNDVAETPFVRLDMSEKTNNSLCLPSLYNMDSLSAVTGIPEKIRCESCTRLNAPSNLRICADCKKSCLCLTCLTEQHWGHRIEKIAPTFQTAIIQKESAKTLEKLVKWKGSVTEGYRQLDVVNMKMVDDYKWLYTKAICDSDLTLLQAIKEQGNIEQLEKSIDYFTGAQVKLRSNVEELEKSLSDIIKAKQGRHEEGECSETTEN